MNFTGIHHVVIRVQNLEQSVDHWTNTLGLELTRTGENIELGVKQAFFELAEGGFIELVTPLTSGSPLAKTLEEKGEGVQLISLSVEQIEDTVSGLKDRGVSVLGDGSGPYFVHPKSANGTMLGLAQTVEAP